MSDEIERMYTREATDSLYDEVARHEETISKLTAELVSAQQEVLELRQDVDVLEESPVRAFKVEINVRPRQHKESADVLADELEETEKELFDLRGFYLEEVRLCATLAEEVELLHEIRRHRSKRLREAHEALEAERAKAKTRDRWIGVALGAAFLLGGYVGVIFGCA